MFTVGMELDSRSYFMGSTMLISLPTGSKVFNWLCTLLASDFLTVGHKATLYLMYLKMFVISFVFGGTSGIVLSNNVIDICLHDTYYVVSHFHVVLSLGTVLAIFIGVSYYQESLLMEVLLLMSVLFVYHTCLVICGILLTFCSMHYLSFNTLPRRISDFPDSIN